MRSKFATYLIPLLIGNAYAATTNTTLTVNATAALGATGISITGTANFTNIGNGQFSSSVPLSAITGVTVVAPFTITLSDGTMTGNLSVPTATLLSSSSTASATLTVTGGTGNYAGAAGTFTRRVPSRVGARRVC